MTAAEVSEFIETATGPFVGKNEIFLSIANLTRADITEVMDFLQCLIEDETKSLYKAASDPASGVFDYFLSSVNRYVELYQKLYLISNNRNLK